MTGKDYYDFEDIDIKDLFKNFDLSDFFKIKDLGQRKLFLEDDIEDYAVQEITRHILQINKEDMDIEVEDREPIKLYITSNGGYIDSGLELVDAIVTSKTPIYTINLSYQYSMACIIGIVGHERYAMPNAKFLLHDGSDCVFDSTSKLKDYMNFASNIEKRIEKIVLENTKISEKLYKKKSREEWYMFADEAKKYGLVDYVVGEDVCVDSII